MLTSEYLRELLDYEADTGIFRWRSRRPRIHVGMVAGCVQKSSRKHGYTHHRIRIDGKLYVSARLAWLHVTGEWPPEGLEVEHENGDSIDNRWDNLRLATKSQNRANVKKRSSTGHKGVYLSGEKFVARIQVDKKQQYIGTFNTPEEAHAAYVTAAKKHFGEFARAE